MSAYKVAIVGAGPAGYFAAQALQNLQTDELQFSIDMIERLPTPWGLVRSGVAPDHPKIKTVSKVFEKVATAGNFRLFGNVELGTDISIEQLKEMYDAVVIATGSAIGKRLGIPGEDLPGSISAAEFVPWYNAHPDFHGIDVPLDCDTAVVIGAGGEFQTALNHYKTAKSWEVGNSKYTYWPHVFQIELQMANCLEGMGQLDAAIEVRRQVNSLSESLGTDPEMP
jgi:NADPH-dependent glutamate synthase beta subunit-like oxidoreductase